MSDHRNIRHGSLRHARGLATVVLLTAATACGNVTAGGLGEVVVDVSGDAPPPSPAPSPSAAVVSPSPLPSSHDDEPEGEVEVEFMLFLVTERGSQVGIGDDEIRVRVDLQGRTELEAARELVPSIRFTELRMVFTEISAEVEGGLVIGGIPIIGEVRVDLEDLSLLVTRPIDIEVMDGQTVELLVDLNAAAWLAALDPITLTVDETVFRDLVDVVVR